MRVSAHRYRQSRQGATRESSRWFVPVVMASIFGAGALIAIAAIAVSSGL